MKHKIDLQYFNPNKTRSQIPTDSCNDPNGGGVRGQGITATGNEHTTHGGGAQFLTLKLVRTDVADVMYGCERRTAGRRCNGV